jgi:hypothetical protein
MNPWLFLPIGYFLTVLIEGPILFFGLSARHSWRRRVFAGFWLTACTYPMVVLIAPNFFDESQRGWYLLAVEPFAAVAECTLFLLAFGGEKAGRRAHLRDCLAIVIANVMSFGIGEVLYQFEGVRELLWRVDDAPPW